MTFQLVDELAPLTARETRGNCEAIAFASHMCSAIARMHGTCGKILDMQLSTTVPPVYPLTATDKRAQ